MTVRLLQYLPFSATSTGVLYLKRLEKKNSPMLFYNKGQVATHVTGSSLPLRSEVVKAHVCQVEDYPASN
jgi:hypothetical protein